MTGKRLSKLAATGCLGVACFAMAACGDDASDGAAAGAASSGGGKTLSVYMSLPFQGAGKTRSEDMALGAKIALRQAGSRAGDFRIKLVTMDNSTPAAGTWDPGATSAVARKAAADDDAIAYHGELNSGATAISLPILNESGILMVSAANTAVGLTRAEGAEPGEPEKYYPTGERTYGRVVPADHLQAAATVQYMEEQGCAALYVLHDNEVYGEGLAKQVQGAAGKQGIAVKGLEGIDNKAPNFRSVAAKIVKTGADCFYFGGITANNASQLYKDVNAAGPQLKLFGPDGVGDAAFSENLTDGVERQLFVTLPTLPPEEYPEAGRKLVEELREAKGGSDPDAYALYSYEAMNAILQAIEAAGPDGDDRAAVVKAFRAIEDRDSVLGTYSIDENGDTTLTAYGGNRVEDGRFVFDKVIGG